MELLLQPLESNYKFLDKVISFLEHLYDNYFPDELNNLYDQLQLVKGLLLNCQFNLCIKEIKHFISLI
jgi:hypothetical protein